MECKVRIRLQISRKKFYAHTFRLDQSRILSKNKKKKNKNKNHGISCVYFLPV